jgi:hypothetical protein
VDQTDDLTIGQKVVDIATGRTATIDRIFATGGEPHYSLIFDDMANDHRPLDLDRPNRFGIVGRRAIQPVE